MRTWEYVDIGVPAGVRAGVATFALLLAPFFAEEGPGVLWPAHNLHVTAANTKLMQRTEGLVKLQPMQDHVHNHKQASCTSGCAEAVTLHKGECDRYKAGDALLFLL